MSTTNSGFGADEDGPRGPDAVGSLLPGKNPRLPPTSSLSPSDFEDFAERLLAAHRTCPEPLRHVTRVARWGRPGDKQDGIDFEGQFSDGKTASWQCKRYESFTVNDVKRTVQACTFKADQHYLVLSCEASRDVRAELAKHPEWQLLDQRGLKQLLDDLPLHKRRDVLDQTWGVQTRKLLLEVPGEDAFLTLDSFSLDRLDNRTILNDLAPRVGREGELDALASVLDRGGDWPAVVLVTGPGGRGKTRLVVEALLGFQRTNPQIPVVCLSPGRVIDAAAMSELPLTPVVLFVDDAHRDPTGLGALLNYVRGNQGTQLILASRTSGSEPLKAEIANARYAPRQIETIPVGELTKSQARALVESLTPGVGLTLGAREYFAEQAVDSPHVAVIAANLLRRGELSAPLVVDAGLRGQILARYQEVAAGEVEGVPSATVRRVLAVYAALGPVDDSDDDELAAKAAFCGLELVELLRLLRGLQDRGVLVTRTGLTRVVPDVLADDLLEREAAVGQHDTGFARRLWGTFGAAQGERLVLTLAELDWRLRQQGGPSVIGPVWGAVRDQLRVANEAGLVAALRKFRGLAFTQPHPFLEALEEVRARLDAGERETRDRFESLSGPTAAAPSGESATVPSTASTSSEVSLRRLMRQQPTGPEDVRRLMPELYGQCAASAPELLEKALDALWALRRGDSRPPHQTQEHPERVLAEALADLGGLPDPTFPARIVARVGVWLAEPEREEDVTTALFALRPLLAKEGSRTIAVTRRQIAFQPFAISAEWARPIRDAARLILSSQASGADLRRAGAAVELLGEALRQPTGQFGRSVDNEEILAWEDDDLATVAVLRGAAEITTSQVIRRLISQRISWTAEHAVSLPLRHAALTLLASLDDRGDDLAELLLQGPGMGEPARRGRPVPTLEDLEAARDAEADADAALTQDQRDAARNSRIQELIARRDAANDDLTDLVGKQLIGLEGADQIVEALDTCAREIRVASPRRNPSFWSLFRWIAVNRPDGAPDLIQRIATLPAGPLDEQLYLLLGAWLEHDEVGMLTWLTGLGEQRTAVRLSVATAFVTYGWADRTEDLEDVHRRGVTDQDPAVRDQFMRASHMLLAADPRSTVASLLAHNISPAAATHVLNLACHYDGMSWGRQLSDIDALAVLDLIDHAGWDDYTVQHIAAGIARAHPRLVLDHLVTKGHPASRLIGGVDGFASAFDETAAALVQWLVERARPGHVENAGAAVAIVMDHGLTPAQARHLAAAVDSLPGPQLLALVVLLREIGAWPLQQPVLARRVLARGREVGEELSMQIRYEFADALRLRQYGFVNGVSPELEQLQEAAAARASEEPDPELKELFEQAAVHAAHESDWTRRRYEEDEDD